mgnify:CR=1 FL=1
MDRLPLYRDEHPRRVRSGAEVSPPLRVGVNAIFLEPGMGGIETYLVELMPALLRLQPSLRFVVLSNVQGRELLAAQPWSGAVEHVTPRATRRGMRALYELGPLGAVATRRFDVLHSPALTAPLATAAANVVVMPDTTWVTAADLGKGQAATVRLWRAVVPLVARRADRDGDADLYVLVYGPPERGPNIQANNAPPNHLFRNEGNGTFTDVSKESKTDDTRWALARIRGEALGQLHALAEPARRGAKGQLRIDVHEPGEEGRGSRRRLRNGCHRRRL